jgi:hypothetical protein
MNQVVIAEYPDVRIKEFPETSRVLGVEKEGLDE